jgi:hypothetical protein
MWGQESANINAGMSATVNTLVDFESTVVLGLLSAWLSIAVVVSDGGTTGIARRLATTSSFLFLRIHMVVSVRRRRDSVASRPFLKSDLREFSVAVGRTV